MKNVIDIILEYKKIALHNSRKSIGSPDGITHDYKEGQYEADYDGEGGDPYAFIYNKKKNKVIFSDCGYTHRDIFYEWKGTKEGTELGLDSLKDTKQLRYTGNFFDGFDWKQGKEVKAKDEMKKWYNDNKEILSELCSGRIWFIDELGYFIKRYNDDYIEDNLKKLKELPSYKDHKNLHAYIAFWNDIPANMFKKCCDNIIKLFNETHKKEYNIEKYIAVGNNGEPIFMDINDSTPIKVKQRSKEREKEIEKEYNNHNPKEGETQEEFRKRKRKNTEEYRKNRDSNNQKTYNHTKSKTEAEWRNIRYQESLNEHLVKNNIEENNISKEDILNLNKEPIKYNGVVIDVNDYAIKKWEDKNDDYKLYIIKELFKFINIINNTKCIITKATFLGAVFFGFNLFNNNHFLKHINYSSNLGKFYIIENDTHIYDYNKIKDMLK